MLLAELNILLSLGSQQGLSGCSQWQELAYPDADAQSRLKKLQPSSAHFLPPTIKGAKSPQQSWKREVQLPNNRCLVSSETSHYIPPSLLLQIQQGTNLPCILHQVCCLRWDVWHSLGSSDGTRCQCSGKPISPWKFVLKGSKSSWGESYPTFLAVFSMKVFLAYVLSHSQWGFLHEDRL